MTGVTNWFLPETEEDIFANVQMVGELVLVFYIQGNFIEGEVSYL